MKRPRLLHSACAVAISLALAPHAVSAEEVERIEVTGTHIKRTDM